MKKALKVLMIIIMPFLFLYIGLVIGYNINQSEKESVQKQLTESYEDASKTADEYDQLSKKYNKLVGDWNQQQKDIEAGKYTRTQYVQGPTRYIPSYNSPINCTTNYYSFSDTSYTTCY